MPLAAAIFVRLHVLYECMLRLRLPTVPRVSASEIDGFNLSLAKESSTATKIDPENGMFVSRLPSEQENTVRSCSV